jgi:hypothetical protein
MIYCEQEATYYPYSKFIITYQLIQMPTHNYKGTNDIIIQTTHAYVHT